MTKEELIKKLEAVKANSAWRKGVKNYAIDMIDSLEDDSICSDGNVLKAKLLNGAVDWKEYSYGGNALVYDDDIARALCNNTELQRTNSGEKQPNKHELWLDVQARALYQAYCLIKIYSKGN